MTQVQKSDFEKTAFEVSARSENYKLKMQNFFIHILKLQVIAHILPVSLLNLTKHNLSLR